MHSSLLGFLVVLAAHSAVSQSADEIMEACNKETGFVGDIEKISFNSPDVSKEAKCTTACALEKLGVFKADGSLHREKQKPLIEEFVKDEELKKKYLKAVDECDLSAKANKCETAYEFMKCLEVKAGV